MLIGISAIERGDDYRITQMEVIAGVKDLNSKYGDISGTEGPLIWYEERHEKNFSLKNRLEFFAAADILMVTATQDGLNRSSRVHYCSKSYGPVSIARTRCKHR